MISKTQSQKFKTVEEARKPYENVASAMETQFAEHMIKEMRKGIPKEEQDSTSIEYYNSLMDHERAKIMAEDPKGGLGIKKLILEQILPQNLKNNSKTALNAPKIYREAQKENSHE